MAPRASGYASRAILSPLPQPLELRPQLQGHPESPPSAACAHVPALGPSWIPSLSRLCPGASSKAILSPLLQRLVPRPQLQGHPESPPLATCAQASGPGPSCLPSLSPLGPGPSQGHLPASLLGHPHLLLTLSAPIQILPLNFPFSLNSSHSLFLWTYQNLSL